MVSQLLYDLPSDENYKVIFMKRKMKEILTFQSKMLERMGNSKDGTSDAKMGEFFNKHLSNIIDWIEGRKYIDVLYIDYSNLLTNPDEHIKMLNRFLDYKLNEEKAAKVIDRSLYRNR